MAPSALLYSKEGCHLCEQAKAILNSLATEGLLAWTAVDIQDDPALYERYWDKIPVVSLEDGRSWYGKISEFRLRRALEAEDETNAA